MSEAVRARIEQGLAGNADASRAWAELSPDEQTQVIKHVDHAVTAVGRSKRTEEMIRYLGYGADSLRAYLGPLTYLPADTSESGPWIR